MGRRVPTDNLSMNWNAPEATGTFYSEPGGVERRKSAGRGGGEGPAKAARGLCG